MEYTRLGSVDLKQNIGQRVFVTFLARDVSVRFQKDKVTKMVVFNMVDKDTCIEARIFGATDEQINMIKEGTVYNGAVDVKPYEKSSNGYSCIIYNMDFSNIPANYFADWADGLDESRDVINNALVDNYETIYGKITYPILIRYWDKFSTWSAASSMHHTQLGGLLTHTAEVVSISSRLADYFNDKYGETFINKPLLVCAAMLHDIGKIQELDVDPLSGKTEYSTHSVLASHIMDILKEVDLEAYNLGLGDPEISDEDGNVIGHKDSDSVEDEIEAVDLLKHCLAAHHGKLEYGSPITASTPEAILLHMSDMLSSEMFRYNKNLKDIEPGSFKSTWLGGEFVKYYKDTSKMDTLEDDSNGKLE